MQRRITPYERIKFQNNCDFVRVKTVIMSYGLGDSFIIHRC